MIGRKLSMVVTVFVLGITFAVAPAMAVNMCSPGKTGTKGCKNELKACKQNNVKICMAVQNLSSAGQSFCKSTKAKDKRKCKAFCLKNAAVTAGGKGVHGCVGPTGIVASCKTDPTICTASPSGAFVF